MDRGKHIFTLKINIGGIAEMLLVFENDEPSLLAQDFKKRHKITKEACNMLEKEIEKNIDVIVNEEEFDRNNYNTLENPFNCTTETYFKDSLNSISKLKTMGTLRMSELSTLKNKLSTDKYLANSRSLSPITSRNAIYKVKLYRFQTVFQYLNPNKQGKITAERLKQLNLNQKLYCIDLILNQEAIP